MTYISPAPGRIALVDYTGNGAALLAVTGVGFQPVALIIYHKLSAEDGPVFSFEDGFAFISRTGAGVTQYSTDTVISFDPDGFTVGDGTDVGLNVANINARVYRALCF